MTTEAIEDGIESTEAFTRHWPMGGDPEPREEIELTSETPRESPTFSSSPWLPVLVDKFLRVPGSQRSALRSLIADTIMDRSAHEGGLYAVLQMLLESPVPGSLDDAVDILSITGSARIGELIVDLLRDGYPILLEDPTDYDYALVKALLRASSGPASPLIVYLSSKESRWVGAREAAIEGLGEFLDAQSKALLESIADDPADSEFFRDLAREMLARFVDYE